MRIEGLARRPSEFLGIIYVDSISYSSDSLEYACRVMGANRIVFGSDCPFRLGEGGKHRKRLVIHRSI